MKYNPDIHHRKSIRLPHYDYSQNGMYFVTICAEGMQCIFGKITEDTMILNDAGKMIEKWWIEMKNKFPSISLDEFVVMPNHFHGIICIENDSFQQGTDIPDNQGTHTGVPLHTMVQWFKTMTTNEYIRNVHLGKYPSFEKRIWQRNYHEHIIRNQKSSNIIREYIIHNPLHWNNDKFFTL